MDGRRLISLLKKAFPLVKLWGWLFSILSLGYFTNQYITAEKDPIVLSFGYFGYLFLEGLGFIFIVYFVFSLLYYMYFTFCVKQEEDEEDDGKVEEIY